MTVVPATRAGAALAALGQSAAAVTAHLLAAGCLPGARGLALALPATVVGVLLLGRLLPDRPLLRLAGGQLVGHLSLGVAAACAGHPHAPGAHMLLAHVGALVLLRAVLDRAVARVERAVVALLRRCAARPTAVVLPAAARPAPSVPAPLRRRAALRVAPVRGPPRGLLPAT